MADAPTPSSSTGPEPYRGSRIALVFATLIPALALDLWTKAWAWEHLRQSPGRAIVPNFFHLEFAFNTGSAFGFLRDAEWSRWFFIVITLVAIGYLARLAMTLPTRARAPYVAIGLIAGGAIGNLHDRLIRVYEGAYGVVDFIVVFYWPGHRWPAFNIADAVLVAGVLLFLLVLPKTEPQKT
jgi:signal peptidase II